MKVLVAYDGTLRSKEALRYGVNKVRENGGDLVALHVFNSNQYIDYDVFGAEEAGRAASMRFVSEAKKILEETGKGIRTRVIVQEGNPEEETINYARENNVDLLLCSPGYKKIISSFRMLFGDKGTAVPEYTGLNKTEEPAVYVVSQR